MDDPKPKGYRYGKWAGEPKGRAERLTDCRYQVFPPRGIHHQCNRRRGHGPNGEYCAQHAKVVRADWARPEGDTP